MHRTTFGVILSLSIIIITSAATPGQPATEGRDRAPTKADEQQRAPSPETVRASRTIRLFTRPSEDEFRLMVRTAAAEHADVLGLSADAAGDALQLAVRGNAGGPFGRGSSDLIDLTIDLRDVEQGQPTLRASEFLDGVITSLERQLAEWHARERGLAAAERELQEASDLLARRRARFRGLEQEIRKATGRADASVDAIRSSLPKLDEERQALKLQVVGNEARQQALAEAIERLAKAAGERAQDDPVAVELQKIVELREMAARHARQLHEAAQASAREVSDAEAAVAEARAKLLERRDAVARANGGELLETLNRELAMLSIDAAEAQAKLAALEALLTKYLNAEELLQDAADVRRERDDASAKLQKAESRLSAARSSLPEPIVRVIQSDQVRADDSRVPLEPAGTPHPNDDDRDSPPER